MSAPLRSGSGRPLRFLSAGPALLLAASSAFALILAEAGVRIYQATFACHQERAVPRGLYPRDDRYHHVLKPGYRGKLDGGCWETQIDISASGTRGAEIPEKSSDRRILLGGDSYVFGLGVEEEETLAAHLAVGLSAQGPGGVEVVNSGVPGWTTYQLRLLIEDRAESWKPDLFVVHLYLGNDVEERVKIQEPPEEPQPLRASKGGSLIPSSQLLRLLRNRLVETGYVSGVRRRPLIGPWFDIFLREAPARVRKGYDLIESDLERIRATCAAHGIALKVVVTPSWTKVIEPTAQEACRSLQCEAEAVDMDLPNEKIAGILERLDIPYLDLTETMVEAFRERRYRFVAGHWDAAGTRIAANRIAAWLAPAEP